MKERKGLVFNVGTPSILVILLVFVLCVFALMSIQASNNEKKLADKTGASVQEYYQADQKAEYAKAYISAVLQSTEPEYLEQTLVGLEAAKDEHLKGMQDVYVKVKEGAAFQEKAEQEEIGTVAYAFPVHEDSKLKVEMTVYSDRSYQVTQWKLENASSGVELDEGMGLWDGTVPVEE